LDGGGNFKGSRLRLFWEKGIHRRDVEDAEDGEEGVVPQMSTDENR
jgi:hypothetical protein